MSVEVSVIVPVYNAEQFLDDLIQYMVNQTFRDFELICVDDGSTDSSLEILRQMEVKFDWIHILTQQNQYAGVARNNGMEIAKGKYLLFLDADDIFKENMLEELYWAAEKCEADIVVCGARAYYIDGDYYQYPNSYLNVNLIPNQECFSAEDIADHIIDFTNVAAWNKLFRKVFIIKNQITFMSTKRSNDAFFVMKSLTCAQRITVVPKCLMTYCKENVNSLQGSNRCQDFDFYAVVKQMHTDLIARGVKSKFYKSFSNKALSICLYNMGTIEEKERYEEAFRKGVDSFYEFGFVNHGRGYYYNKRNFERMITMLESDAKKDWEYQMQINQMQTGVVSVKKYPASNLPIDVSASSQRKVSVLVWVEAMSYLKECLKSLQNQTLQDFEVICVAEESDNPIGDLPHEQVKDSSVNPLANLLEVYAEKDSRFRILHAKQQGKSECLNEALGHATGEYIYFMEGSDYLHSRALEILYAESECRNLSVLSVNAETVFTPEEIRYVRGGRNPNYIRKMNYSDVQTGRQLFARMNAAGDDRYYTGLCFYRREFLEMYGLSYEEGLLRCEEIFMVKALSYAERACHLNINLLKHRVTEEAVVRFQNHLLQAEQEVLAAKVLMDSYFQQEYYSDALFGNAYLDHGIKIYKNAIGRITKAEDAEIAERFDEFLAGLDFKMRPLLERILEDAGNRTVLQNIAMKSFQNQDLKGRMEKLKLQKTELKEQKNSLKKRLSEEKTKVKDLKQKLVEAKKENEEARKIIQDLNDKITLSRVLKKIYRILKNS